MNLSDIAILYFKGLNYRCIISGISKRKAINLMRNADLTEKSRNIIKHKNLFSRIKIAEEILTFDNIEIEKSNFYCYKSAIFLLDVDIEKVLVFNKNFLVKKTISTLLVTRIMIGKLSRYI